MSRLFNRKADEDSAAHLYPRMFESVRTLIDNGICDMDCNFMGTDIWISPQHWSHAPRAMLFTIETQTFDDLEPDGPGRKSGFARLVFKDAHRYSTVCQGSALPMKL